MSKAIPCFRLCVKSVTHNQKRKRKTIPPIARANPRNPLGKTLGGRLDFPTFLL